MRESGTGMKKTASSPAALPAGSADTRSVGNAVRGRAVLVTGASRGIGAVLARTLARAGADVAISARPEVCSAVLRAIEHDTGETLLGPVPVRPWLALLQLFPAAARPLLSVSGLGAFLEARARRAAEQRRDGL